jgi:tripartite-type tricarboxylate transporter receptor subunit TctC
MERMAGIELTHVPYKGSVPAASVISGETSISFSTLPAALPTRKRALVPARGFVSKRSSLDTGRADDRGNAERIRSRLYSGVWAPKGTPRRIVTRSMPNHERAGHRK